MEGLAQTTRIPRGLWPRATGPRIGIAIAGLVVALLLAAVVVASFDFGDRRAERDFLKTVYPLLLAVAAASCLFRAATMDHNRGAWSLIGIGLAFWVVGELDWTVSQGSEITGLYWFSDACFLVLYAAGLAGILALRGGAERNLSLGLLIGLLGLATVWAAVTFGGDEDGLRTLANYAYPLLDVGLVAAALAVWTSVRWRRDWSLAAVVAGMTLVGLADTVYLIATETGAYQSWAAYDFLWPAGALLVGLAPWLDREPHVAAGSQEDHASIWLVLGAGLIAFGVLLVHLLDELSETGHDPAAILALATLFMAMVQAQVLYRERAKAKTQAVAAAKLSAHALGGLVGISERTYEHGDNLAELSARVATELWVNPDRIEQLRIASRLLNVGKIANLARGNGDGDGAVTPNEPEVDAVASAEIAEAIGASDISLWIRHHEEWWDGSGGPDGLSEEEIPFESRLLAVTKAIAAIVDGPIDASPERRRRAAEELEAGARIRFDPGIAAAAARTIGAVDQVE